MNTTARPLALWVLAALLLPTAGIASPPPPADTSEASVPRTIEQVWFRTVKGNPLIRLFNTTGDLTISRENVSFSTSKKTIEVPIARVQQITYGKIKGDVNTEWVLLGVGEQRADAIIAIRDGGKFGYGQETWDIYKELERVFESLSAAQYRVPPGRRTFDDFSLQFTLAVPENWHTYLQSVIFVGDRSPWGTVFFSAEEIRLADAPDADRPTPEVDEDALERAHSGEAPAIFVERMRAAKGMKCDGFSEKGLERLLDLAAEGALFHGVGEWTAVPSTSPEIIDRCRGLRLRGTVAAEDGSRTEVDLHTAANGDTLFVFGLRAVPERYDEYREVLDEALATVRFSVAR